MLFLMMWNSITPKEFKINAKELNFVSHDMFLLAIQKFDLD